jgi:hypothetical protein
MAGSQGHDLDPRPVPGGPAPEPAPGAGDPSGGTGGPAAQPAPGAGDPGRGTDAPRRRWWGSLPGWLGVLLVLTSAALGALATALSHREPGTVLGVFVLAGTAAATLIVRPRAVYLIIPVPALAYVVAAAVAGLVHDHATDTSRAALAVSAAQWIAGGFTVMAGATVLAIVATIARWPWRSRGQRGPG